MTHRIIKRPAAGRDIEECFVHIAQDNLDIGVTFLVAVEDSLERLADFPFIGTTRDFQDKELPSVKVWPVKGFENYLIFYTANEDVIDVIRLLHGSRDIEGIFS